MRVNDVDLTANAIIDLATGSLKAGLCLGLGNARSEIEAEIALDPVRSTTLIVNLEIGGVEIKMAMGQQWPRVDHWTALSYST